MKNLFKLMRKNKLMLVVMILIWIGCFLSTGLLLYSLSLLSGIENFLRLVGSGIIIIVFIAILLFGMKALVKNKILTYLIIVIISILYFGGTGYVGYQIYKAYGSLNNFTTTETTYSSSIVTLKDNKVDDIKDLGNSKIGILNDEKSVDGYQIPKEIIKEENLKVKTVDYDSYADLLTDLYEGNIDYVFLPTNYTVLFKNLEGFDDLESKTKIIYTKDKTVKNKNSTGGKITKPFTILLMGVDSELESIQGASFNGDSLMLLTFNPETLNTTILSIPRDSYVPIACFKNKRKNKITHAAWYGEECMINTISEWTGIPIDYYVKINFKGVVKLVDALGGVDVDVPIEFCEQDSNRNMNNQICLSPGQQTLNGEQALALARHRKTIDDFRRGQNQQLVVKGLMNKVKTIRSVDTIQELLATLSNNMETNMSTSEILSLYDIAKDIATKSQDMPIEDLLTMQRLYISGYDQYIYDYSAIDGQGTRMRLYNFVAYEGSKKDVVEAMKINLGLKEPKIIKKFSFNVDTPYEETVIGKGEYKEARMAILPSFIGYDKSKALSYGSTYGFSVNIKYTSSTTGRVGQIIDQSAPEGMDVDYVGKLTITVIDEVTKPQTTPKDEEEDKETTTTPPKDEEDTGDSTGSENESGDGSDSGDGSGGETDGDGENNGSENGGEGDLPDIPGIQ